MHENLFKDSRSFSCVNKIRPPFHFPLYQGKTLRGVRGWLGMHRAKPTPQGLPPYTSIRTSTVVTYPLIKL